LLWVNLGLICVIGALLVGLASLLQPRVAAAAYRRASRIDVSKLA